MDSKSASLIRGGADHSSIQLRCAVDRRGAADDDRKPTQRGPAQLLDRCVERVEVEMDDRAIGHERTETSAGSGAGVLPPLIDVRFTHVACANHQFHVWNSQVWCGSAQHPRRWIVLVLVDALI